MLNAAAASRTTINFADLSTPGFHLLELDGAEIEATPAQEEAMELLEAVGAQARSSDDWARIAKALRDPAVMEALVELVDAKEAESRRIEAARQ